MEPEEPPRSGSSLPLPAAPCPQAGGATALKPGCRLWGTRCKAGERGAHLPPPRSGAGRCHSRVIPLQVCIDSGSCSWSHLRNTAKSGDVRGCMRPPLKLLLSAPSLRPVPQPHPHLIWSALMGADLLFHTHTVLPGVFLPQEVQGSPSKAPKAADIRPTPT